MLLPETLAHSASRLARLSHLQEAGVSSPEFSPRDLGVYRVVSALRILIRQLSEESGWVLGWVIRIQISESAARTRNAMERMAWPISWSTTQASKPNRALPASRNPDNFAQHSGVQPPRDSTKDSKQKELTEKERG